MMDILEVITKNRLARNWSEYQLAEKSGLPQSTISSWYRKQMNPSLGSLEKICNGFGITLSQFFALEDESISLTPEQRKLLDKWATLSETQQAAFLSLMEKL